MKLISKLPRGEQAQQFIEYLHIIGHKFEHMIEIDEVIAVVSGAQLCQLAAIVGTALHQCMAGKNLLAMPASLRICKLRHQLKKPSGKACIRLRTVLCRSSAPQLRQAGSHAIAYFTPIWPGAKAGVTADIARMHQCCYVFAFTSRRIGRQ
ncbi:MAG: hypothetical protein LZF61_04185 [Nitrosomonas sp.]|nr:MAG: hypothetical protein LZF61_04185 [Nitrosomonas sp.]